MLVITRWLYLLCFIITYSNAPNKNHLPQLPVLSPSGFGICWAWRIDGIPFPLGHRKGVMNELGYSHWSIVCIMCICIYIYISIYIYILILINIDRCIKNVDAYEIGLSNNHTCQYDFSQMAIYNTVYYNVLWVQYFHQYITIWLFYGIIKWVYSIFYNTGTMWGPPVINWFINPINYSYKWNRL